MGQACGPMITCIFSPQELYKVDLSSYPHFTEKLTEVYAVSDRMSYTVRQPGPQGLNLGLSD